MKVYLEPEEVNLMEEAADNLRDRLLIHILFKLGCRISEVLAMKVEDIDLVQGMVTIQHLKSSLGLSCPECGARLGRSHCFCPRCGAKVEEALVREMQHRRVRTLPMDDDSLEMLARGLRKHLGSHGCTLGN